MEVENGDHTDSFLPGSRPPVRNCRSGWQRCSEWGAAQGYNDNYPYILYHNFYVISHIPHYSQS